MNLRSLGRLGLAVAGLVCLFAVYSVPAFGAGKPTVSSVGGSSRNTGPNHAEIEAWANPNGSPTTLTIQYRVGSTSEWITAGSKEIGSGTEIVTMKAQAFPIVQRKYYETRATATNAYGSATVEGTGVGVRWGVRLGVKTSSYISSGTFRMEWEPSGGFHAKMECTESGSGNFGPAGESFNFTASGCSYYMNNSLICHPKAFSDHMNNVLEAETIKMELCPGEGVLTPIAFLEPLFTSAGNGKLYEWAVVQPVAMTAKAQVAGHSATATISSTWQLSGENVGKEFTLVEP